MSVPFPLLQESEIASLSRPQRQQTSNELIERDLGIP
jgi:hypothetical protein